MNRSNQKSDQPLAKILSLPRSKRKREFSQRFLWLSKMHLCKRSNVFLIHAHADRKAVHKLYSRLIKDEVRVWMDVENLQPGQDWQNEIRKAILKSNVIIVCLSRGFDQRHGYRHEELSIALERSRSLPSGGVFIIPVRLEKCEMPDTLRHLHRVDLFETGGYGKLIRALRGEPGPK